MTQWANKLNVCHQTFHKEVLHVLNDLKRVLAYRYHVGLMSAQFLEILLQIDK